MKTTVPEIKQLWEKAFKATLPASLSPYDAFTAVFLHMGQPWIETELRKLRSNDGVEVQSNSVGERRDCCGAGVRDYHYLNAGV